MATHPGMSSKGSVLFEGDSDIQFNLVTQAELRAPSKIPVGTRDGCAAMEADGFLLVRAIGSHAGKFGIYGHRTDHAV